MTDTAKNPSGGPEGTKTVEHQVGLFREYLSRGDVQEQMAHFLASHGGTPVAGALPQDVDGPRTSWGRSRVAAT